MKRIGIAAAFAAGFAVLGAAPAFAQGTPEDAEKLFKCNLKTIKDAWWCEADYCFLEEKDVEPPPKGSKDKKPLHKETDHELVSKKACVQVYYHCRNHIDQASRSPGKCRECKEAYIQVVDMQAHFFICFGCGGRGPTKKDIKHMTTEGHDQKILPTCDAAGQWPHNTKKGPGD